MWIAPSASPMSLGCWTLAVSSGSLLIYFVLLGIVVTILL